MEIIKDEFHNYYTSYCYEDNKGNRYSYFSLPMYAEKYIGYQFRNTAHPKLEEYMLENNIMKKIYL